ncbi:MAG: exosortase system-associated protein, TIGR04073 family [Candidatus Omnitrophica bacterium]|nr:exosortase system-associated protein, TIGR04073 family [Candidatus Omnitrophota bacterium]MCA9441818.1 exosortase system-associated protein, TIGR04073 family [Candidatus Omnitrophota bacterium]
MGKQAVAASVLGLALIGFISMGARAETATEKLGRGLANTFLGVLEIPNQMKAEYNDQGGSDSKNYKIRTDATVRMISVGPVRGVREAIRRTGHGIWDVVTFLSPSPEHMEYEARIDPAFIEDRYAGGVVSGAIQGTR